MSILAVNFSESCNNNCSFCFCRERDFLKEGLMPKPAIDSCRLKKIILKNKNKCRNLLLAGNEPTLNSDILEILLFAKKNKYRVEIQTNGRLFAYKDFCKKILETKIDYITVTLLSNKAQIHDSLTMVKGSFKQTVNGIKNIVSLGGVDKLAVCAVVTKKNYLGLKDIVDFVYSLGIKRIKFNCVYSGIKNIVPNLFRLEKYLIKAIEIAKRKNIEVKTFGFPSCILGNHFMQAMEFSLPEELIVGCRIKKGSIIRKVLGKRKPASCAKCVLDEHCEGTWKPYFDIYKDNEFKKKIKKYYYIQ